MQEVVGLRLSALFLQKVVNEFTEFSESDLGKTPLKFVQFRTTHTDISQGVKFDFTRSFLKLNKVYMTFILN